MRHKEDGGETSLHNLILASSTTTFASTGSGWQLVLHPDGTTEARSPNGKQTLSSHAPPAQDAA